MYNFNRLRSDHIRQVIDTEQVFDAWLAVSAELSHSFVGSMGWKLVGGRAYLYRKTREIWKSLGPRSAATEQIYADFHEGRKQRKERLASLASRLDEMAAVNRAMRLGRLPTTTARVIRALARADLIGSAFDIVGTNALFAYERMAGVTIDSGLLATGDVDLLFDARKKLKLLPRTLKHEGLVGILRSVDKSFQPIAKGGFRAANEEGFLVDLVSAPPSNRLRQSKPVRLGDAASYLAAVEIEGLQWLINSPKITATVLDERGYPVRYTAPDPRSFALHKLWLSRRDDRDPLKKWRDKSQAEAVAGMLRSYLPHLGFDDPVLGAMPRALRSLVNDLDQPRSEAGTEPNW